MSATLASPKEIAQVEAETAFWRSHLPVGWRLFGHTYCERAAFISPTGRIVDVDGELLRALTAEPAPAEPVP